MMSPYTRLFCAIAIHAGVMYVLAYVAIDSIDHAYLWSTRPLYMVLAMISSMVIVMVLVMRPMYDNTRKNIGTIAVSAIVLIGAIFGIQNQWLVGNEMFLKSMIPHHSGAITTCEGANLTDPEIITLCENIIRAQEEEIEQMQNILERLKNE